MSEHPYERRKKETAAANAAAKEAAAAAVAAPSSSAGGAPAAASSSQMTAVMRLMNGMQERTIAEKMADANRPTWEQYKEQWDKHETSILVITACALAAIVIGYMVYQKTRRKPEQVPTEEAA